ncbi:hypothetical protein FNV43_RR06507 [Rhamnella rubrinervis]|uniref:non-specific serine/threonine protein kinase n=1 Tax=Rhamnella rubrinervis TaxID=2594499 RepID=A0A8K0MLC9_9ROSA|nr:hypothetical protein FNV43_RR06507 [Rhamnella rubrinervis]
MQDKQVWRDFEIQKEAKGVDKAFVMVFNAVQVKNRFLEIRFHWSGKGTTATPKRGIYGPLISAIDVESEFKPPHNYHVLTIVAAIISGSCLICIILGILWWKCYFNASREKDLKGLDLHTGLFTLRQIKAATNNFDSTNKIGEGGFGSVFKQGNREFVNEIGMISGLQHLILLDYMDVVSKKSPVVGEDDSGGLKLDWPARRNICVGIARGLTFLHEESPLKVVHRDIKTTNVLLDGNLNPKISDFGLAKLDEEENTHISTRIAGTIGYMAPEYALWGYLTYKADVYSFGVVALEVVAGKSNMKYRPNENYVGLVDWALVLQQKGNLMELVDPKLGSDFNKEEVVRLIKVALLCTNPSPALRPTMSAALSMLEGHAVVPELIMDPSIYGDQIRLAAIREQLDQIVQQGPSESQSLIRSSDTSQIDSSATSDGFCVL